MAAPSVDTTPFLIVDMSTLRFRRNPAGTAVSVLSRDGAMIATVPVSAGEPDATAAHRAMACALRNGTLGHRTGTQVQQLRVALYNPFSGEVEVEISGASTTFATGPVSLPFSGAVAKLGPSGLRIGDQGFAPLERTPGSLLRSLAGHAA